MYRIVVKKNHRSEEWEIPMFPSVSEDLDEITERARDMTYIYPAVGVMDDDKNITVVKREEHVQ